MIVDDGKEFYGDTMKLMEKHDVIIQRGDPSSQGIVERFNRTLEDRLFTYQYHKELEDPLKSNREWVSRLQNVVSSLNNEKIRLIGMKPVDAIKQTVVEQRFSQPAKEYEEKLLDVGTQVRYLYKPGELEGYQYKGERRKRSTDAIWSVDVYKIKDRYGQKHQPTLYYLDGGHKTIFCFRRATAHSPSLVISSHTRSSSFCFEWVFSCGMFLAYSTFPSIINSFFKTKE